MAKNNFYKKASTLVPQNGQTTHNFSNWLKQLTQSTSFSTTAFIRILIFTVYDSGISFTKLDSLPFSVIRKSFSGAMVIAT